MTGVYYGRWASRQHFLAELETGSTLIEYATVKPEMGAKLFNVSSKLDGQDTLRRPGMEDIAVSVWQTTLDGMPLKVTEWVNNRGDVVQMVIDSGAGKIEAILSTQATAEHAVSAETAVPELVDSTHVILVKPEPQLHSWAGATTAVLTVSSANADALDLPHTGYQHISPSDETGSLKVSVNLNKPIAATPEELRNLAYAEASAMIDTEDEVVRAIAEAAVGVLHRSPEAPRTRDQIVARSHLLRQAVKSHIKNFNLATGYASASETARRAEGDCSEHAVLLAALLRVDGIPSRVCSGLVYTERSEPTPQSSSHCIGGDDECLKKETEDRRYTAKPKLQGSFAWHAWTQAMVLGDWVDLDATLWHVPYSVGHLLMGTSALEDAVGHADEMKLVSMIGNLEIRLDSVA
jgi:hypothetical protein